MVIKNVEEREMSSRADYTIAFDLGGTSLKYGYGNQEKGLQYFNYVNHHEKTLNSMLHLFVSIIKELMKQHIIFSRVCIALPGTIDASQGVVLGAPPNLPFLKDVNLKELIDDKVLLPVFLDNDANLMTLAEAQLCISSSVLGITIGTGIGSGFVLDNKIIHGERWKAFEAGHTVIIPNGRQCLCGKKGCLEAYASAESMKRIVSEKFPNYKDLSIYEVLNLNDSKVKKAINGVLDLLAIGIANMVMILNPGTVVLGGGVIEIDSFDFEYLKNRVYDNLMPEFCNFYIKKAEYGNKAGVIGGLFYPV